MCQNCTRSNAINMRDIQSKSWFEYSLMLKTFYRCHFECDLLLVLKIILTSNQIFSYWMLYISLLYRVTWKNMLCLTIERLKEFLCVYYLVSSLSTWKKNRAITSCWQFFLGNWDVIGPELLYVCYWISNCSIRISVINISYA